MRRSAGHRECSEEDKDKERTTKMKYTVSIAVDGRIDIEVDANNKDEAREKALDAFANADLSKMEVVGTSAVNCSDDDGNLIADYE